MNHPSNLSAHERQLIADFALEQLDEANLDELRGLLRANPEARRCYLSYMALVAGLAWDCQPAHPVEVPADSIPADSISISAASIPAESAPAMPATIPAPAVSAVKLPPVSGFGTLVYRALDSVVRRPYLWTFIGCMGVAVCYVTIITWGMWDDARFARHEGRSTPPAPSSTQVATITASENAQWQTPEAATHPHQKSKNSKHKSKITRGSRMALASGTVQLQLKQGVTMVVEGPARWSIDGDNHATLDRGKLVATVPKGATGFSVKTPTAEIVDLGTEFGVRVDADGDTHTEVFRGIVEIALDGDTTAATAPAHARRRVVAGEAVSIGSFNQVTAVEPETNWPKQLVAALEGDQDDVLEADRPRINVAGPPSQHLQLWLRADRGVEEREVAPGEMRVVRWKNEAKPDDPGADLVQGNHPQTWGARGTPAFDPLQNSPIKAEAALHDRAYPVVRFRGTDYLRNASFPPCDSFTAFVVVKKNGEPGRMVGDGYTSYHNLLALGIRGYNNPGDAWAQILEWRMGVAGARANTLGANFANDALDLTGPNYPPLLDDDFQLVVVRKNNRAPGLTLLFYNGYYIGQSGGTQEVGPGLFLGGTAFGGLNGDLAEVLIYGAAMGEPDRQLVEGLLAWKYGIAPNLPRTHLYFKVDPRLAEGK